MGQEPRWMLAGWVESGGEPVRVMTTRSCPFSSVMTAWPDWPESFWVERGIVQDDGVWVWEGADGGAV